MPTSSFRRDCREDLTPDPVAPHTAQKLFRESPLCSIRFTRGDFSRMQIARPWFLGLWTSECEFPYPCLEMWMLKWSVGYLVGTHLNATAITGPFSCFHLIHVTTDYFSFICSQFLLSSYLLPSSLALWHSPTKPDILSMLAFIFIYKSTTVPWGCPGSLSSDHVNSLFIILNPYSHFLGSHCVYLLGNYSFWVKLGWRLIWIDPGTHLSYNEQLQQDKDSH